MKYTKNFFWLDLLRGMAALLVCLGHLRLICFAELPAENSSLPGKILFFLTGFGHESVIIFFVLSGFLIIKSIHESVWKQKWTFFGYINNRMTRLWVVLIPALILGVVWDKVGLHYYSNSLAYTNNIRYFNGGPLIQDRISVSIFFENVFFLHSIYQNVLGSNSPLWSLSCEFWYYIIFPLLYFSISSQYNLRSRILFFCLGLTFFSILNIDTQLYAITWLCGGLSYLIYRSSFQTLFVKKYFLIFISVVFFITLIMLRFKKNPLIFNDYFLALVLSLLIPALTLLRMDNERLKRGAIFISNISFTLYVVHQPIFVFITSLMNFQSKQFTVGYVFNYILILTITFLYAILVWYIFERNTHKVKKWVENNFVTVKQPAKGVNPIT
ncbi:MAG: putative acyltransferase [Sphingobacteriales bacterium]|nr:putative acyltransferase [Sphingobacteriales bacterium]